MVEVSLAEVLVDQGRADEAATALAKVDVDSVSVFNSKLFRYLVACTRVGSARGDSAGAASAAAQALDLVDAPSQYSRHPGVGVVQTDETVTMLRACVRKGPGTA
jgi:hypothetical protein